MNFLVTTSQSLLSSLYLAAVVLLALIPGLLFYGYLVDRVGFEGQGRLRTDRFGRADVVIAAVLALTFLILVSVASVASKGTDASTTIPGAKEVIAGVILSTVVLAVLVGGLFAGLSARRIRWREVFGFDQQSFWKVVGYGLLLVLLALPIVQMGLALTQILLAASGHPDDSSQELVRFLANEHSKTARWVVAASACVAAPVLEETIFRGYIHGVARRYVGVLPALVLNAALFAAIHNHLPSFGGLFLLAACLTLAYEWTGSLFVPITMHSLFNTLSVVSLLGGATHG